MILIVRFFIKDMNIWKTIVSLFTKDNKKEKAENKMKFLIAGLGNIGDEYDGTRHNIGFRVADALAASCNITFEDKRYGFVGTGRAKSAELVILKPSTYMNLSGNAVRYWLQKENIPVERMLVVCDDISLPFGKLRMRPGGSDGGHNGLKDIEYRLGTTNWSRIRIGVGNDFHPGSQVDYVLGQFEDEQKALIPEICSKVIEGIKNYSTMGPDRAMNLLNTRHKSADK